MRAECAEVCVCVAIQIHSKSSFDLYLNMDTNSMDTNSAGVSLSSDMTGRKNLLRLFSFFFLSFIKFRRSHKRFFLFFHTFTMTIRIGYAAVATVALVAGINAERNGMSKLPSFLMILADDIGYVRSHHNCNHHTPLPR